MDMPGEDKFMADAVIGAAAMFASSVFTFTRGRKGREKVDAWGWD